MKIHCCTNLSIEQFLNVGFGVRELALPLVWLHFGHLCRGGHGPVQSEREKFSH